MSEITKHNDPTTGNSASLRLSRAVSEASARIGLVVGAAAGDVIGQLRQEIPHFAAAFKPEIGIATKGIVALAVAAVGGLMALMLVTVALIATFSTSMPWQTAALIGAGIWGVIAVLGLLVAKTQITRLLSRPNNFS